MLGLPFQVVPSRVSEALDSPLDPADHVLAISARKAGAVARDFQGELVLGADTVVVLDGDILEKPTDPRDASRMLSLLSGKTHRVFTGLTLIDTATGRALSDVAVTSVTIRRLSAEDIRRYVETEEPLDKAGAYAAQGRATVFIESVSGCFYNVVGLPLACFWNLIDRLLPDSPWSLIPGEAAVPDLMSSGQIGS
jgi:septum formation protein